MIETPSIAAPAAMRPIERRFGLGCALITPVTSDGKVDTTRLVAHARHCLADGCSSFTVFGTTGEGASLGLGERAAILQALRDAGFDFSRQVLAGVAAAAVEDAAAQANQLLDAGGRGLLLAPPFYFKVPSDEGLFRWFASVLERCRSPRGVVLYHIPSVTQVPLSSSLIGRLARAFPGVVTGVKDSSGDWANAQTLLVDHPELDILIGDERQLARAMRHGASGAINGFSNFCAPLLCSMIDDGAEVAGVAELVDLVLRHPVTPAVKALVALRSGDDGYANTLAPLLPATPQVRAELGAALAALFARHDIAA